MEEGESHQKALRPRHSYLLCCKRIHAQNSAASLQSVHAGSLTLRNRERTCQPILWLLLPGPPLTPSAPSLTSLSLSVRLDGDAIILLHRHQLSGAAWRAMAGGGLACTSGFSWGLPSYQAVVPSLGKHGLVSYRTSLLASIWRVCMLLHAWQKLMAGYMPPLIITAGLRHSNA